MRTLSLPEALLLLGFDAQDDTTRHGIALSYALAGAELHELAIAGRVAVDPGHVVVADATPTGDPQLDELLARIAGTAERPRRPGHWVMKRRSAGVPVYSRRLAAARVLRSRRTRILGIVPRTIFPIVDVEARDAALAEVRAALADPAPPPPRAAALVALLHVSRLASRLVSDDEERDRAERIAAEDVIASAVKRAVDGVWLTPGPSVRL